MSIVYRIPLLISILCLGMFARAADAPSSDIEAQVKAAYLYKFAAYIEWPSSTFANPDTPIIIGIVGADAVANELNVIKRGRTVKNRELEVKLLKPGVSLAGVQILFIGSQDGDRLKHLLEGVRSQPVLAVTDAPGGLDAGSVINFVPVDDRIRFDVSVAQAERSGLKISSRLLGVARKVESGRQ